MQAALAGAAAAARSEELPLVTAVVTPRFVPSCTPVMLKVSMTPGREGVLHCQPRHAAPCVLTVLLLLLVVWLQALGDLSRQYNLPVQSHLSESPGEVAWVKELHPGTMMAARHDPCVSAREGIS